MRNHLRRVIVAFLALGVLTAALASPGLADDKKDLQRKKKEVSGKIDGARDDLNHSSAKLSRAIKALEKAQADLKDAESTLASTRGKLSVAKAHDVEMASRLKQAEGDLERAEVSLERGESRVKRSESEVKQFTIESLQNPDSGMRAFAELLEGASPRQFTERVSLTQSVSDAQAAKLDTLEARRVMLDVQREAVQRLRDDVAAQRKAAAENLKKMERLEEQAVVQQAAVSDLVDQRGTAKSTAAKLKAEDLASLNALEAERRRLESQIQGLSKTPAGKKRNTDSSSRLSKPVEGYITSHFGWRVHPIYGTRRLHAGTDFGAPCGRAIRAAASGTIISAGWAGGYGNRIVMNHGSMGGKNIATTYNHMSRYAKRGGHVSRGTVIGYVGTTGSSTGCHLHFEVLVNGSVTNPLSYL